MRTADRGRAAKTGGRLVAVPDARPVCELFTRRPGRSAPWPPDARAARRRPQADEVDGVVLVGGSTRMPVARDAVRGSSAAKPLTDLDPDQVVALGAAIQANVLAGNRGRGDELAAARRLPAVAGLETMGGLVEKIIPRNSTMPTARAQDFTTFKDGQTAMSLHVVQGERELVATAARWRASSCAASRPMVAGAARIRVTFQIDADGCCRSLRASRAWQTHR
jgi:molecular chaperone HscA